MAAYDFMALLSQDVLGLHLEVIHERVVHRRKTEIAVQVRDELSEAWLDRKTRQGLERED